MKIKLSIKEQLQVQPEVFEQKINTYLEKNFYRIQERGPGFVIFIDDVYRDRKNPRSDFHTRIGEGKFEFNTAGQETAAKLIYLTSVSGQLFFVTLFGSACLYIKSVVPFLFSFWSFLPVLFKVYNMNKHVFNDIMAC